MDLSNIWNIIQVTLGIGLVIFVHEAGHFLAARWCKVRVEVFSLGFGPKIFGWTRGDTLYQIAAVPLGGYVKMAGEDVYDRDEPRREDDLGSKTVGQRFLIYSGGVIMNMIFALVVFPFILMAGVPFAQPMIDPVAGGAAWKAGLVSGSMIESVNGDPVYAFMHIPNGVALGSSDETELVLTEPGSDTKKTVRIKPEFSERQGIYTIGVDPGYDPQWAIVVGVGSAAEKAGLKTGHRLKSVAGTNPALSVDKQFLVGTTRDYEPIEVTLIDDDDQEYTVALNVEEPHEDDSRRIGVAPPVNLVHGLRDSALTANIEVGDFLEAVDGKPLYDITDLLVYLLATDGEFTMSLVREDQQLEVPFPALSTDEKLRLAEDIALRQDRSGQTVMVSPHSPAAEAGLVSGDRIIEINSKEIRNFDDITKVTKEASSANEMINVTVLRDLGMGLGSDQPDELTFSLMARPISQSYGFGLTRAQYIYKASGPVDAVQVGFISSWKFIEDAARTLKGIMNRKVSSDNVGGIITIAVVANSWASIGITKLLFFLCLLSVNLAFLNVLPIPVLDGGHLFFLLIEKLKGSPVSEKVMSYSQLVGLVLIVSLMIYVIHNDVMRWFFNA